MEKINRFIAEYLNSSYGDTPDFQCQKSTVYNPYTFSPVTREFYLIDNEFICKIDDNHLHCNSFNHKLVDKLCLLFGVNQYIVFYELKDWFITKKPPLLSEG